MKIKYFKIKVISLIFIISFLLFCFDLKLAQANSPDNPSDPAVGTNIQACVNPPEVNVSNPTQPIFQWTISGNSQERYWLRVYDQAPTSPVGGVCCDTSNQPTWPLAPVLDTGEVSSNNNFYQVPAGQLEPGRTYWWCIAVKDAYDWTGWAGCKSFNTYTPIDIGLRVFNGTETVAIAAEPSGTSTSLLRIAKNGVIYGIALIGSGDPNDSGVRIQTNSGIKALKRYIPPACPVANLAGDPTSGDPPLVVQFTDLSSSYITSWSWNFGDGGTSTEQSPSHVYEDVGDYTVSLTVIGPGGSDTITKSNYIRVVRTAYVSLSFWRRTAFRTWDEVFVYVTVKENIASGPPIVGATVQGTWSGGYSGTVSGTTDASGQVTFFSGRVPRTQTVTFTVNAITKDGDVYELAGTLSGTR